MTKLKSCILKLLHLLNRFCFFFIGLFFIFYLRMKLLVRRVKYCLDLWLFEMRFAYILRIIGILVLFYLPPMEEIDIVWWICEEFLDIFLGLYCLVFFLYYIAIGLLNGLVSCFWNWVMVYPWLLEFWSFFTTFWFVRVIIFSVFYNELWFAKWKELIYRWWKGYWKWLELKHFLQIGWYHSKKIRYAGFKYKMDLMKDFIKSGTGRTLRKRLRGMFRYGRPKWRRKLYKLTKFLKFYDSSYWALVISMWFGLFLIYMVIIFTILYKLLVMFVFVKLYWVVLILCKWVLIVFNTIIFFFWQVWSYFGFFFSLMVTFWSMLFVDCFMIIYLKISSVFFLIEYWYLNYVSIEMFKEAIVYFGFSSNFFSFFYQGFIYIIQYIFNIVWTFLSFIGYIIYYLDWILLHFKWYVIIQAWILSILVYILDILIALCDGAMFVGLMTYHVIVLTVMQCMDYFDFNALSVGVGIWVDFYVIILVCWILDFEFRWYLRAVAKPNADTYKDVMEKSLFLPTAIKYGPAKTHVYVSQYLRYIKEQPKECEKFIYYKESKYFTWSSSNYMEIIQRTWKNSWNYVYDFWTGVCDYSSINQITLGMFLDKLRGYDFDYYWKGLRRGGSPFTYGFIEFEEEDVNHDVELLMEWYIEWYAYETGMYTEGELYRYIENYKPTIPTVEFLNLEYKPQVAIFAAMEELDYYYDSSYYPNFPYIYHYDRHSIARYYNCEHSNNLETGFVYNNVSTYFWIIPLIWVLMFFFGWGTTLYQVEGIFESFIFKLQYVYLQTYALSSSWFDFLFNWPFLELFPGLRGWLTEFRACGRTWNWVIWGNRRFLNRRYSRANTARQLIALKYEYPWLVRFRLRNRSKRWRKWWGRYYNIGYRLKCRLTQSMPWRFKPLYEWSDISELDALVHFVSLKKARYDFSRWAIDMDRRRHFSYQFLRNAYKKICRYRNEDFKWLNAWKRFYKALGVEKEDLHFPYEVFRFRGKQRWRLRRRIRRLRNFWDSRASVDYNQLGLIKHYLISDYSLNINFRYRWRWHFYNIWTRFSDRSRRDYPVPSMDDMRFYASAHYSLYNSWRYLYGYSHRPGYWQQGRSFRAVRYNLVWKNLYRTIWDDDDESWADPWYDDYYINNKKFRKVRIPIFRVGKNRWNSYRDSSLSFLSGFMFEQCLDRHLKFRYLRIPTYLPRFYLRAGNFLFYKYFRRELAYKYWFELAVRKTYWEPIRIDAFNLWFFRDLEIRGFDGLFQTILNIYAYMDYTDQKRERNAPNVRWFVVNWPIPATDEIYQRHIKSWPGIKRKPVFWSIIGRFPLYRYEKLDYRYYNFIGYSGQRKRWMKRHLIPYFLD